MDLSAFQSLLLERCGIVFEDEKAARLEDGIRSRMGARGLDSPGAYFACVLASAEEFDGLVDLLTVNETYFFREATHLALLAERLAPELLRARPEGPLRILSAGCSTGEEPYSILLALADAYGLAGCDRFRVTGVDIDTRALARAREGVYGRNSFRGGAQAPGPGPTERYFEPWGEGLVRVCRAVRERVDFARVNLAATQYPPGLGPQDVIYYRNVSIYFPSEVKKAIFARLAELLVPGGYLFLGASETAFHDLGILSLEELGGVFLYRKAPARGEPRRRRAPSGRSSPAPAPLRFGPPPSGRPAPGPSPRAPVGSYEGALARLRANDLEAALRELQALPAESPGAVKAHCLKGCVLLERGRLPEARAAASAALAADGFCLEAFLLLGLAAKLEGRGEEALGRFREAVYVDPAAWLAHYHLAELHAARGETDRAAREYELTVRLLRKGRFGDHGLSYFPVAFGAEHFVRACEHWLGRLHGSAAWPKGA